MYVYPILVSQTLVEPMLRCCQQIPLPHKTAKRKVRTYVCGSTCICTYTVHVFAFVCMCMIVLLNRLQIAWLCPTSDTQLTFATIMVLTQHSALLLALTAQPYTVYTYVCTYVWNVSVYIRTYVHCMLSGVFSVYVRIYVLAVCTVCTYVHVVLYVHAYMCIH